MPSAEEVTDNVNYQSEPSMNAAFSNGDYNSQLGNSSSALATVANDNELETSNKRPRIDSAEGQYPDWHELPSEVLVRIFQILASDDADRCYVEVVRASKVCRVWRNTAAEILLGDTAASRPVRIPRRPPVEGSVTTSLISTRATFVNNKTDEDEDEACSRRRFPVRKGDSEGPRAGMQRPPSGFPPGASRQLRRSPKPTMANVDTSDDGPYRSGLGTVAPAAAGFVVAPDSDDEVTNAPRPPPPRPPRSTPLHADSDDEVTNAPRPPPFRPVPAVQARAAPDSDDEVTNAPQHPPRPVPAPRARTAPDSDDEVTNAPRPPVGHSPMTSPPAATPAGSEDEVTNVVQPPLSAPSPPSTAARDDAEERGSRGALLRGDPPALPTCVDQTSMEATETGDPRSHTPMDCVRQSDDSLAVSGLRAAEGGEGSREEPQVGVGGPQPAAVNAESVEDNAGVEGVPGKVSTPE